jgi:preprotein translocase subunit SecE
VKSAMLERARDTVMIPKGVLGLWGQGRTFLSQVRNEMERVTWPSGQEVQATTLVVILTSFIFGVYLWGIDMILNVITGTIFRTFGAS